MPKLVNFWVLSPAFARIAAAAPRFSGDSFRDPVLEEKNTKFNTCRNFAELAHKEREIVHALGE